MTFSLIFHTFKFNGFDFNTLLLIFLVEQNRIIQLHHLFQFIRQTSLREMQSVGTIYDEVGLRTHFHKYAEIFILNDVFRSTVFLFVLFFRFLSILSVVREGGRGGRCQRRRNMLLFLSAMRFLLMLSL